MREGRRDVLTGVGLCDHRLLVVREAVFEQGAVHAALEIAERVAEPRGREQAY